MEEDFLWSPGCVLPDVAPGMGVNSGLLQLNPGGMIPSRDTLWVQRILVHPKTFRLIQVFYLCCLEPVEGPLCLGLIWHLEFGVQKCPGYLTSLFVV